MSKLKYFMCWSKTNIDQNFYKQTHGTEDEMV